MDKDRIARLKAEVEQRATQFFEAYHQAIGASKVYANLLQEMVEDEEAENLKESVDEQGKKTSG